MRADEVTAEHWETVVANTGLIWLHVNRLKGASEDEREEAYQDGLFGLLRAAQKFDPQLGWRFSTYANAWIRRAIQRGREIRLGINYRRAVRDRDHFERPLALDVPVTEDGATLGELLEVPEPDIDDQLTHDSIVEHLRRHCRDDLDHALVDEIDMGGDRFARRVALERGFAPQTGRDRMLRLRRLAAPLLTG